MKRVLPALFVIIIGIGLMLYPVVSKYVFQNNATTIIADYKKAAESIDSEEINSLLQNAQSYNEDLAKGQLPYTQTDEETPEIGTNSNYHNLLNIGEVMGYVEIPKIRIKLPIYHGTSDAVLEYGIGHLENSSLPVGGKNTHCVLSGHTGLTKAKYFDDLTKMEIGDYFYIHVFQEILAYKVCDIFTVLPHETDELQIIRDRDLVTLVTCTPYGINSHRLYVRGERVEFDSEIRMQLLEETAERKIEAALPADDEYTADSPLAVSELSQACNESPSGEKMTNYISEVNRYISDHPEQVLLVVAGICSILAITTFIRAQHHKKNERRRKR